MRQTPPAEIRAASRRIQKALMGLDAFVRARCVGCYVARPDEAQTRALIRACLKAGKQVCVPAWRAQAEGYAWARVEQGGAWAAGRWNIPEPARPRWAPAQRLDFVVVPGVAFDRAGGRVGHGRGFFDRLLAEGRAFKAGAALEKQLVKSAPMEAHDVFLDAVVTERNIYLRPGLSRAGAQKTIKRAGAVVSRRASGWR